MLCYDIDGMCLIVMVYMFDGIAYRALNKIDQSHCGTKYGIGFGNTFGQLQLEVTFYFWN